MKKNILYIFIIAILFVNSKASGQYHIGFSAGTGGSFLISSDQSIFIPTWQTEGELLPDWTMFAELKAGYLMGNMELEAFFGYKFIGYQFQHSETQPPALSWTYRSIHQKFRGHSLYLGGSISPTRFQLGKHILAPYFRIGAGYMREREWSAVEQRRSRLREVETFEFYRRSSISGGRGGGWFGSEFFINPGIGLKFQNPDLKNRFSFFTDVTMHKTIFNGGNPQFGDFYEIRVGVGFDIFFKGKGEDGSQ